MYVFVQVHAHMRNHQLTMLSTARLPSSSRFAEIQRCDGIPGTGHTDHKEGAPTDLSVICMEEQEGSSVYSAETVSYAR